MKLERWVLFIDMLGYGEINRQITDEKKGITFLDFMKSNEKIFTFQNNNKIRLEYKSQIFDLYNYYEIQTTFISDSLIINYNPIEVLEEISENERVMHSANTLIIIIGRLQSFIFNCLKEHKILIRGGVSNKFCLVRDKYAVGEGVLEAYKIESKVAIYPRIVLSKSIINNNKLITSLNYISKKLYNQDTFLKVDSDGIYFIDYLKYAITALKSTQKNNSNNIINSFLKVNKETIENKLKTIENKINNEQESDKLERLQKIKYKLLWIKEYYNECVQNEGYKNFYIE